MKAIIDKLRRAGRPAALAERPAPAPDHRILFVCMGNICRSPTAAGMFRKVLAEHAPDLLIEVASAGTHAYHIGEAPDPRACRAAERRGIDISQSRARRVGVEDFDRFDLLLAMDELNHAMLRELAPEGFHERIRLLMEFAPHIGRRDVPDPYYGGSNGFEYVLDLVEEASRGLVDYLRRAATPQPERSS